MLLYAHGTGALAHDGHILRISAEGLDIVLHPADRGHLVIESVVAGKAGFLLQLGQAYKAHRPQAVVKGHADDSLGGPHRAVKMLFVTAAAGKTAAVDIDQHRQLIPGLGGIGGKHVEEQAVLAVGIGLALAELVVIEDLFQILLFVIKCPGLIRAAAVRRGIVDALPAGDLHRILPSARGGIADAFVRGGTGYPSRGAPELSAGGIYQIFHKPNPPVCYS